MYLIGGDTQSENAFSLIIYFRDIHVSRKRRDTDLYPLSVAETETASILGEIKWQTHVPESLPACSERTLKGGERMSFC